MRKGKPAAVAGKKANETNFTLGLWRSLLAVVVVVVFSKLLFRRKQGTGERAAGVG